MKTFTYLALALLFALDLSGAAMAQPGEPQFSVLDSRGHPLLSVQDGNAIQLRLELPQAAAGRSIDFYLEAAAQPVAGCTIAAGEKSCQTALFPALGWYWDAAGQARPQRSLSARTGDLALASLDLAITPRPLVLVHGFNADWHTWDSYVGAENFLAPYGLHGYAVGDGQVVGVMHTGSLGNPFGRTNTIAENAAILGEYIAGVRQVTGAEQVDLVVHSMGGMISRYYIDRLMQARDVAQLIILGTPMAGSSCATLPAALGVLLPATLEIQPAYMEGIFNQQVYHRRGVPFYALAGTKLLDAVQSPCTPVPSDLVVTVDSVRAIPMPVDEIALLHIELNTSREVFERFVLPHLQTPPGGFVVQSDPPPGSSAASSSQFSKTYTGHLNPGENRQVVIPIDAGVSVANFALYDTSRSLTTQVTGASGNVIELDPVRNGVIQVDDPTSLLYLGYGFVQPRPGRWVVTLQTTSQTPASGADYAIMARFSGGASLHAGISTLLPQQNQVVEVQAELSSDGQPLNLSSATAVLRQPDGSAQALDMQINAGQASLALRPAQAGLYGLEINVSAQSADGFPVERAVMLAFEAQPNPTQALTRQAVLVAALLLVLALLVRAVWRRISARRASSTN